MTPIHTDTDTHPMPITTQIERDYLRDVVIPTRAAAEAACLHLLAALRLHVVRAPLDAPLHPSLPAVIEAILAGGCTLHRDEIPLLREVGQEIDDLETAARGKCRELGRARARLKLLAMLP